jgi:nucleoside-diphosphate-sugar epimerase
MEKILVTGGAGYKGIKVVEKLLSAGNYDVTVLDNFMYGYDPILHLAMRNKLSIVKHDIRNKIDNLNKFDVIIHLAGISGYPACAANLHSAELINVEATRQLVKDLGKGQLIINASTTSFYGKSGKKCTEDTPIEPVSMYGITKYKAEQAVAEHDNSISLRFATVFGPSPKMRMDLMVNDFVYKAINERCVVLFDSYAKRTFIHVDDAADCYFFAVENRDKMKDKVYNAGGGHLNYSKLEIANKIREYIDFKIIDSDIKDNDVRNFIIDYSKIEGMGFFPKKTLEEGIKEFIKLFSFYEYHSHFKTI